MSALDPKAFQAAIGKVKGQAGRDIVTMDHALEVGITAYLEAAPSGQAPLEGVAETVARAIDPLAWVVPDDDYPAERSRREAKQHTSLQQAHRAIAALLPASAEPVGRQHRIYYEDTGKWSDWRDGKRNTRFDNEFEERPVYASPPASLAVEAGGLQPTHWHCKDYADGWISFDTEAEALEYQRETGCLLRVVYRHRGQVG